jgi:hypothetical protein
VASAVCGWWYRRLVGRAALWRTSTDQPTTRSTRSLSRRWSPRPRVPRALECSLDAGGNGNDASKRVSDLESLRPATASHRKVQAVDRSPADREGPRSSGCVSTRLNERRCCAPTRRARSRQSIRLSRRCPCDGQAERTFDDKRHGTTSCSPLWMWPQAKSSASCIARTEPRSFVSSWIALTRKCRATSRCISSWITTRLTRLRSFTTACFATRVSTVFHADVLVVD